MTKCAECGGGEFLKEKRWYLGRKRCWHCDMCFKIVDVVHDLMDHPDLVELEVMIYGFYGDPWATSKSA